MSNLLNFKFLAIAILLLASIAGSLAYRNAKEAEKEAAEARSRAALQQAITHRRPPPGVVHHSDQGIQYACADYVAALKPTAWFRA